MAVKKTDMAIMKTEMAVKKTPMQVTKTTTDTSYTIHVNCLQCHHNTPTATTVQNHQPMPQMQQVQQAPLPQFVAKRPVTYPQMVQQPPMKLPPLLQLPPEPMPRLMVYKQPWPLPQAVAKQPQPLPVVVAKVQPMDLPTAKALPKSMPLTDLPALVRTPDKASKPKTDSLPVLVAEKKRPAADMPILTGDAIAETGWRTATDTNTQDLLSQMLPEQRRSQTDSATEYYVGPGEVDWEGLPSRPLPPGVLYLPPQALEPEDVTEDEAVLPPLPRSASKTVDPGLPYQAAPARTLQTAPAAPEPQVDLQGLPKERLKELLPG